MINPSSYGWVEKFFTENQKDTALQVSVEDFYIQTRNSGFIMGHPISFPYFNNILTTNWLPTDYSKLGLLVALYNFFQIQINTNKKQLFLNESVAFYKKIHPKNAGLLEKVLINDPFSNKLEKNINARIQTNNNIISKNFSHILTNALLFVDILAFEKYLNSNLENPKKYIKKIEEVIVSIVTLALNSKVKKSKYDDLVYKLFHSSLRYSKFNEAINSSENIDFSFVTSQLEQLYLFDIAVMTMWNDGVLEKYEQEFLLKIAQKLQLPEHYVTQSISNISYFLEANKSKLPYFNYSNPVKHFYDQTTNSVQVLISKNKTRLLIELAQSKELIKLLSQSTHRELNPAEKKKVKKQMLDICKAIPSLTIFLLPGGSLLLPLLIKFIPQLLPSAFNENLNSLE